MQTEDPFLIEEKSAPSPNAKPVRRPEPFERPDRPAWEMPEDHGAPGFFERYRVLLIIAGVVAFGVLAWNWSKLFPHKPAAPKRESLIVVNVPPPPPPPPVAPPPPPPPMEQKMIEQAPVENEPKPEPTPDEPPAADLGTALKGDGPPDAFNLSRGGGPGGGPGGPRSEARGRWDNYASRVQSSIQQAVRNHRATRTVAGRIRVKVWADGSGRVTRASLGDSTGNAGADAALRDQILARLTLPEPPPQDMPMPINLRISLQRP